jgi:hypothetical protein
MESRETTIAYAILSAPAFINTYAIFSADAFPSAEALPITHARGSTSAPLVAYVLEITGIYRNLILV